MLVWIAANGSGIDGKIDWAKWLQTTAGLCSGFGALVAVLISLWTYSKQHRAQLAAEARQHLIAARQIAEDKIDRLFRAHAYLNAAAAATKRAGQILPEEDEEQAAYRLMTVDFAQIAEALEAYPEPLTSGEIIQLSVPAEVTKGLLEIANICRYAQRRHAELSTIQHTGAPNDGHRLFEWFSRVNVLIAAVKRDLNRLERLIQVTQDFTEKEMRAIAVEHDAMDRVGSQKGV